MAVKLDLSVSWAKYGTMPELADTPALSIALRVSPRTTPAGLRFAQKWTSGNQAFRVTSESTGEVGFIVSDIGGTKFGRVTTGLNMVGNGEYGIVCTWRAGSPGEIHIVVNGNDESVTDNGSTGDPATLADNAASFGFGTDINQCYRGNYAEGAVWASEVPLEVAKAISLGASPAIWQHGLVLYDPLRSLSDAIDVVGGRQPSFNGSAVADLKLQETGIMPFMPIVHKATAVATTIPVFMNHYRNQGIM